MNDNQKERLLKIAENNPELAKDVVDILKQESSSTQEPIAVKMVKSEDDKITITPEQKKWAMGYIGSIVLAILFIASSIAYGAIANPSLDQSYSMAPYFFIIPISLFSLSYYCAYKAGMPAIKQYMQKHFKFIAE